MEEGRYDGAESGEGCLTNPPQEGQLRQEQAQTEVGIYPRPVIRGTSEGQEDIEADGEADDADRAAGVSEDLEVRLVSVARCQPVDVQQDSEVGEVITLAHGGAGGRL